MRILFLTTLSVVWEQEHFFTLNVFKSMAQYTRNHPELELYTASILLEPTIDYCQVENRKLYGVKYQILHLPSSLSASDIVNQIVLFFKNYAPDVIHSNMIEGFDVKAAQIAGIPIILTMHIGGLICPRGGGNGLLKFNDTICNGVVGKDCHKCMLCDLPFSFASKCIYRLIHSSSTAKRIAQRNKPIPLITPICKIDQQINGKLHILQYLKYAHVVAANSKLCDILTIHLDKTHIHLLPHGVSPRKRLSLPSTDGVIKFYILSRLQYSKGIIDILKAFKGIPHKKYELHIIGGGSIASYKDRQYLHKIEKYKYGLNIINHGWLSNDDLESTIQNCHIMIHGSFCHEIYGIAIAESLSMGRGVIASRCGGAEMQIIDGRNGLLFTPHSVEELRQCILAVLEDKSLISKFASNSHLPMHIDNYTIQLIKIYKHILELK